MKLGTSAPAARGSSLEGTKGAGWVKEQRKCGAEQPWEGTGSSLKPPALLQLVLQPELFPARGEQGKKKGNKWSLSTVSHWKGLFSLQGNLWGTALKRCEGQVLPGWRSWCSHLIKYSFMKVYFHPLPLAWSSDYPGFVLMDSWGFLLPNQMLFWKHSLF